MAAATVLPPSHSMAGKMLRQVLGEEAVEPRWHP